MGVWEFIQDQVLGMNWLNDLIGMGLTALGLDTGPMSGFDRQYVDDAFFAGSTLKSNLLINIGYGDSSKLFARLPRLSFEEACGLL